MKKEMKLLAGFFLFAVLMSFGAGVLFAQEEEEEPIQPYSSPLENHSYTMRFLRNHFGSFSIKAMEALKAKKLVRMTVKKDLNKIGGFSAKKGTKLLVGATKTGIKIKSLKKGDRGIILHNTKSKKGLKAVNLNNKTVSKKMMHKGMMHKGMMHKKMMNKKMMHKAY